MPSTRLIFLKGVYHSNKYLQGLTDEVLAGAKAAAEPIRARAERSFILIETIRNMMLYQVFNFRSRPLYKRSDDGRRKICLNCQMIATHRRHGNSTRIVFLYIKNHVGLIKKELGTLNGRFCWSELAGSGYPFGRRFRRLFDGGSHMS